MVPSSTGHYEDGPLPGQSNYVADPAQEKWSQQTALAPGLDQANQSMMGQLGSAWANPLDNGAQARQHAEDAIYGRASSRLDPMWNQREHDMTTTLASQGIDPNSAAYGKSLDNFSRGRNDAYSSAMMDAIMGGGQEASRQQGMDLQSRMAPLAGMGGLQGLTGQAANPLLQAALAKYQGALQSYGIQQSGKNSALGGLTGLGGNLGAAGIIASDERLKKDVTRLPEERLPGVPFATFRYRSDPRGRLWKGVIAQDVEAAGHGHLVHEVNGMKYVDASLAPVPHG